MMMLIWLLAANFILTVLYIVIKGFRREEFAVAAFFLFLPILGLLTYSIVGLVQMFLKRAGVDREAVLANAFDIELQPEHPNVRDALNVVPLEDALSVNEKTRKRGFLLRQMRKNLRDNYKAFMVAESDEDSEIVHYVAAAKMEICRMQQTRWLECRKDYESDPDNLEKYHETCEVLIEMLTTGVFSEREQTVYRKRLCDMVQRQIDISEDDVLQSEYEEYLSSLVELGEYGEAEQLWQKYSDRMQSEYAYQNMMKVFYQTAEWKKFEDVLENLHSNENIMLSTEGREHLRYWTGRIEKTTVNN